MKFIFLFFILILSDQLFCQAENIKNQIYLSDGVEINLIKKNCVDSVNDIEKQILFFELVNNNNYSVNISLKKELYYDSYCSACNSDSPEYYINQAINKQSTVEGGCVSKNTSLNIFVKMLKLKNVRQLTNYEFKAIKIEKVS